jgi:hypothetical protein
MKNIYEITDRKNRHLCYQVAENESDAVSFARMYGNPSAVKATLVRAD